MKTIKEQRTQALLLELLSEALVQLNDSRINHLTITEVVCSRGKHDAEVFVLLDSEDSKEQEYLLKLLQKAEGILREYVLSTSGWFKCPHFTFKIDKSLMHANHLNKIFSQIHQ